MKRIEIVCREGKRVKDSISQWVIELGMSKNKERMDLNYYKEFYIDPK